MMPLLRLQLLLFPRRTIGRLAAASLAIVPLMMSLWAVHSVDRDAVRLGRKASDERYLQEIGGSTAVVVLLLGGAFTMNLVASFVFDERRRGRSRLLRQSGQDGFRVVGASVIGGALLAIVLAALGVAGPATVLWFGKQIPVFPLVRIGAIVAGLMIAATPIALASSYFLPRALSLIIVNALPLAGFSILLDRAGSDAIDGNLPIASLVPIGVAFLMATAVLGMVWKRTSERLW